MLFYVLFQLPNNIEMKTRGKSKAHGTWPRFSAQVFGPRNQFLANQ